MTDKLYNLALSIARGIGPVQSARIISLFTSAEEFIHMSPEGREEIAEDIPSHIVNMDFSEALQKAEKEIEWCEKKGVKILTFADKAYPRRLRHIPDKPLALYVRGDSDLSALRTVGIVGTRKITEYGLLFVDSLVRDLKQYGVQIISGMAYGVDAAAHHASVKYDIETIGVLGHGIDMLYPAKNQNLAREIVRKNGAMLTEFPHGTEPEREHFPMRNRIIAGMSDVLIVIESAETGGSMITADLANNYNKDVFALPGRYDDEMSRGCNLLIKSQRAHLLESVKDIEYIMRWQKKEDVTVQTSLFTELTEQQKELIHLLKHHKRLHVDELSMLMKTSQGKLSELLLILELDGLVKCMPGNIYVAL